MQRSHSRERGALRKEPGGKLAVALVYPNAYRLGMANLGLHAVYRLFNADPDARCERAFLPDDGGEPLTVESGRPLREFDVVAFSVSFEDDDANVLAILDRAGLPLRAADRDARHPLVVAGGIALQINPEPLAPFFDAVLVGEGEVLVPPFLAAVRAARAAGAPRAELLERLAGGPGVYVPALYDVEYSDTRAPEGRWVTRFAPRGAAPARVARVYLPDLRGVATSRVVDSPDAQFGDLYLTEVARGCLWGCRFCAAGFVQRPYREVDLETLRAEAREGLARGQRIGLVGPDTSDHSGLDPLTCEIAAEGGTFSPASLRVDAITPALAHRLADGGERSITLAPEAGSQRMRDVINKNHTEEELMASVGTAAREGYTGAKLYFMCGLPGETDDDLRAILDLSHQAWQRARAEGNRSFRITVSVSPHVPKPHTPFAWAEQISTAELNRRLGVLRQAAHGKPVTLKYRDAETSLLEGVFTRGDRRLGLAVEEAFRRGCRFDAWTEHLRFGTWMEVFRDLGIDPERQLIERSTECE
ncbi:MAG TPA: radical SAM protein, partial [Anaeromyxobacter sp.]